MEFSISRSLSRGCLRNALPFLLLLAACLALFAVSGAFQAELGEYPDEPAHFVTSLMVRDYVAAGAPWPPLQFAVDYYLHYPKVALGHYPPLLHVLQAAWMLGFPATKASLLALNAILVALTGTLLYRVVRGEYGGWAGAGVAALWVGLPVVQTYGGMVMAEALVALLVFGAVVCYGRFLDAPSLRNAAVFGLLAALALLTKQSTLLLMLVPPIGVLLAGRISAVRSFPFWMPALMVAGTAGVWYYLIHFRLLSLVLADMSGLTISRTPLAGQARLVAESVGYALSILAAAGFWSRVLAPILRRRQVTGLWAACAACLLAFLLIRVPLPLVALEARYSICIQPVLLVFAAAGGAWLAQLLSGRVLTRARWAWVVALVTVLTFALWTFRIPHRRYFGFSEAAAAVLEDPRMGESVSLVCADAGGEGAFVAAVAAGGTRSGHIVRRATKELATTNWHGTRYRARFNSTEDLLHHLESAKVRVLAVQAGPGPPGHSHWELIRSMLREHPDRWTLAGTFPRLRPPSEAGAGVSVYRLNSQKELRREALRH